MSRPGKDAHSHLTPENGAASSSDIESRRRAWRAGRRTPSPSSARPRLSPRASPKARLPRIASAVERDQSSSQTTFRLVVMGAGRVGKTAVIRQFLYGTFPEEYIPTVEELYRAEYELGESDLVLDILDTSGSFEFPAMRRLAITSGDAFVLVYAIDDASSFEEVRRLREVILETRPGIPIVVAGNKIDCGDEKRVVQRELAETMACIDWDCGYVECSAKENEGVVDVFRQLLFQAQSRCGLNMTVRRRRRSLPINSMVGATAGRSNIGKKRNSCAVS